MATRSVRELHRTDQLGGGMHTKALTKALNFCFISAPVIVLVFVIVVYATMNRRDKESIEDRVRIKIEQENSKRERAENRAYILKLESEIQRLQNIVVENSEVINALESKVK